MTPFPLRSEGLAEVLATTIPCWWWSLKMYGDKGMIPEGEFLVPIARPTSDAKATT